MIVDFSFCDAIMSITQKIYQMLLLWKMAETQRLFPRFRLYKEAFYCDLREPCPDMVDGRLYGYTKTNKCSFIAFVSVDLMKQYSIQGVVVHIDTSNRVAMELKFFTVYLNEGSLSAYCSEWPTELYPNSIVNCAQWPKLFSEVQINSRRNRGLAIREIEVLTLSTGLPHVLLYRGCFENFGDKTMDYEWNVCYKKCFRYGFIFAGIKDNNFCACGNNVNAMKELPLNKCYLKCNDSDGFCGGRGSYSVYLIRVPLPYYEGCYESSANYTEKEVLNGSTDINIQDCLLACNNHRYAVLQNKYCMCEDEIANIQERKISSFCDLPCNKRDRLYGTTFKCGGVNYMSVWSTCKQGSGKFITCSELLQCGHRGMAYHYGGCDYCISGFVGAHCISRNVADEYNETDDFNDGTSGNDTLDYMNAIGDWIKRQWFYILLVMLLTIVGIVLWFNFSSRRNYKRGIPSRSATPATKKRKVGPKVEQKGKKEPRKASTSKKSQQQKSESRKFGKLGKLFRKKQSNVNLLTKTKAKPSVAADSLAKKRKESHSSGLHKPAKKQSIVASHHDKPKQELPVTGVITKPPGEKEVPAADAVNKPKPEAGTITVNTTTTQEKKA